MTNQYPITPVPFTAVTFTDDFWTPRLETNRTVTVPYDFQKCEETGRLDNFKKAAGLMEGPHEGLFFNDSDVFKIMEGAAYSLNLHPDPDLEAYLDNLIADVAASQEEDGYLYTARTIAERNNTPETLDPEKEGPTRWSNLGMNHELYNVGHMYEGAIAHYEATGKRTFLDVAIKNADLIDHVFGPGKIHDTPGHQQIEMGLARLSRVTGDERYLRLAQFFLDERGKTEERGVQAYYGHEGYTQDHLPVVEQDEAVGHAVRAGYMYCGMADVAAMSQDESVKTAYIKAIDTIWANVVNKKLYLTGGIGALHRGEAFGANYELPNDTAYAETCAAIANAMWNLRMFLLHGHAQYIDVIERTIYNGFLSGIDFSGDRFFYVNPLSFDGKTRFNRDDSAERLPWFDCSCCPSNVVRFIPSLLGYVYATKQDDLYVNLFVAGSGTVNLTSTQVTIEQVTDYPWQGRVQFNVNPTEDAREFTLHIRIPGWAQGQPVPSDLYHYHASGGQTLGIQTPTLTVNGETVDVVLENGYAVLMRQWQAGDVVVLDLPMTVQRVLSHEAVEANQGLVALERGPILYCVESIDNMNPIDAVTVADDTDFTVTHQADLLHGVNTVQWDSQGHTVTAIPYYAWAHRGNSQMAVWLKHG
ncbi:MAG: glycoside hydrolase family 127 protein [Chloroflexota bacterium]